MSAAIIGPNPRPAPAPACDAYDPRARDVAGRVVALLQESFPAVVVEHVGSTSIPGCPGKGVVDMMCLFSDGAEREAIKDALERLGFQHQRGANRFPEERPMRLGTLAHDGDTFLLHVHVIPADSEEVAHLRRFRERLRADPALVASYAARKREIIAAAMPSWDYTELKGAFIEAVVADEEA